MIPKAMKDTELDERRLSVLMMEYNNFHDKVKFVHESYSSKVIQALISIGVIFAFCLNSYYNTDVYVFIDVALCILIPIFALGIIYMSLSANVQILVFGEYLISIEKRINQICEKERAQKTINWEQWRIDYGIAREKIVYYDSAFLYIVALTIGVATPIMRIMHMAKFPDIYSNGYLYFWIYFSPLITVIILLLIMILLQKTKLRKKRADELLSVEDVVFGKIIKEEKSEKKWMITGATLIYLCVVCLIHFVIRIF